MSKILVADDDPGILEALQLTLESEGYTVMTTDDGLEVLKMDRVLPDLVLLDVRMSGQDGREVCSVFKRQQATRDIPVIMISANQETAPTAIAAGADDFIAKPFEVDDLLMKVSQHLKKK